MSLLVVYATPGRLDHFAAPLSQQLGRQSALGLAVQDPPDPADRIALSQMSGLRSFHVVVIALASDRVTVMTIIPKATSSIK
jgi:hypothetical protein